MTRAVHVTASALAAVLMLSASPARALSPESQAGLDALTAALAEAKPAAQALAVGLNDERTALKDGVSPASLVKDGNALALAVNAAAAATRGIASADRQDEAAAAAIAELRGLLQLLEQVGNAAPGVFLSAAGKSKAASVESSLKMAEKYQSAGNVLDLQNYLGRATREFNTLSPEDRRSPNGQALVGRVKALDAWVKQRQTEKAADQAASAEARGTCKAFDEAFITGKTMSLVVPLVALHVGDSSGNSYATLNEGSKQAWLERIAARRALFAQLASWCDDPVKSQHLTQCVRPYGDANRLSYAKKDPAVWCQVARTADAVQLAEVDEYVNETASHSAGRIKPDRLESGEGWLDDDLLKQTWKTAFEVPPASKSERAGQVKELYAALGRKNADTSKMTAGREAELAALKQEVARLAPRWDRPKPGAGHYGVDLAKSRVAAVFKAKVVASGGDGGQWNVHANALGVPEYRDRFGWVLFQAPGEPWCQLRTFFISETYSGGGKYQRDTSPSFQKLRFQKCN